MGAVEKRDLEALSDQIVALRRKKRSVAEIARMVRCGGTTVRRVLRTRGEMGSIRPPPLERPKYERKLKYTEDPAFMSLAKAYFDEGFSANQTALRVGVHCETVSRVWQAMDLKRPLERYRIASSENNPPSSVDSTIFLIGFDASRIAEMARIYGADRVEPIYQDQQRGRAYPQVAHIMQVYDHAR